MTALPLAHGQLGLGVRYALGKEFLHQGFKQALVLPNSFKSALIPWWAKIPKRTGWARELRSLLLNDVRKLDKKRYPLMIERFLALGLPAGAALPSVYPYPELSSTQVSSRDRIGKTENGTGQRHLF